MQENLGFIERLHKINYLKMHRKGISGFSYHTVCITLSIKRDILKEGNDANMNHIMTKSSILISTVLTAKENTQWVLVHLSGTNCKEANQK